MINRYFNQLYSDVNHTSTQSATYLAAFLFRNQILLRPKPNLVTRKINLPNKRSNCLLRTSGNGAKITRVRKNLTNVQHIR